MSSLALNQINSNQVHQITAAQFASKYKSKREIYMLLAIKCAAYLPRYENLTI